MKGKKPYGRPVVYRRPAISSTVIYERSALACAKIPGKSKGCTNNPGPS